MKPRSLSRRHLTFLDAFLACVLYCAGSGLLAAPASVTNVPTLEEQKNIPPPPLPRAVRLQGSGGAGGIYYPSTQSAQPVGPAPAATDSAYQDALLLLYRDFRRPGLRGNLAQTLGAPVLNDLALLATTMDDGEGAEILLRLSLSKEDALPVRLNLIYLHLHMGEPLGRTMLTDMRASMSEPRRESIVRELLARGFPDEAAVFVEGWLSDSGIETSPNLLAAARLVGYHHLYAGKHAEAAALFRRLDDRVNGDADVLAGLAASLSSRPAEALAVYRRLLALPATAFKPEKGPPDDVLRSHAALCLKSHALKEADRSLAAIRRPRYEDVRSLILVRLRLNPQANVEPLIQSLGHMPPADVRPGQRPAEGAVQATGGGFTTLMQAAIDASLPAVLVMQIRMEVFGSADPAQIEKDRRIARQLY